MKKIYFMCALVLFMPVIAVSKDNIPSMPTDQEYEEAASIASGEFLCGDVPEIQMNILNYEVIKNPAKQRFLQVCMAGSVAYFLREEDTASGRKVRSGQYWFSGKSSGKHLVLERIAHPFSVTCELEDTTQSYLLRIDYLCFNPTVAAGQTKGEEYSFRLLTRNSYQRECTVYFSDKGNKCGRWKTMR